MASEEQRDQEIADVLTTITGETVQERTARIHREMKAEDRAAAELLDRLGGDGFPSPLEIVSAASMAITLAGIGRPAPAPEDLIAAYAHLEAARKSIDFAELRMIEAMLDSGMTWEQIAKATGRRSRQAMQQRYKRVGGTRMLSARSSAATPAHPQR